MRYLNTNLPALMKIDTSVYLNDKDIAETGGFLPIVLSLKYHNYGKKIKKEYNK